MRLRCPACDGNGWLISMFVFKKLFDGFDIGLNTDCLGIVFFD